MFNRIHSLVSLIILTVFPKFPSVANLPGSEKVVAPTTQVESPLFREVSMENEKKPGGFLAKPSSKTYKSFNNLNVSLIPKPRLLFNNNNPMLYLSPFVSVRAFSSRHFIGPILSPQLPSTHHFLNIMLTPSVWNSTLTSKPISSSLAYINRLDQSAWKTWPQLDPIGYIYHQGNDIFVTDDLEFTYGLSENIGLSLQAGNISDRISGTENPLSIDFSDFSIRFRLSID